MSQALFIYMETVPWTSFNAVSFCCSLCKTHLISLLTSALGWHSQKWCSQKIHWLKVCLSRALLPPPRIPRVVWADLLIPGWVDGGFIRGICASSPGATVSSAGVWEEPPLWSHLLASPLLGSSQGAGLEGGCTGFSHLVGETLVVLNSCLCRNKGGSGGDGVLQEETENVHDSPWGQRMLGRRDELPQYICIPRNCLNISSLPCCVTLFQRLLLFLVAF